MRKIALCLALFIFTNICTGLAEGRLRYFETLKITDIFSRIRRSASLNPREHLHQIWFASFGRNFSLELTVSTILSRDFRISLVDGNGNIKKQKVNENEFFTGQLEGDANSHVEAHWEDYLLSASISTSDDIYVVEPSWRILDYSSNHSLIIYRKSDVLWDSSGKLAAHRESFCGLKDHAVGAGHKDFRVSYDYDQGQSREKRQVVMNLGSHTTCSLFVVADYLFHKNVGGGNAHATANYIIGIINRVNGIYRRTKWPDDSSTMTGLGFEIAELKIHEELTKSNNHYNMRNRKMNTTQLLKSFSREKEFNLYCLAHLFTYQRFDRGVLGLAYISSSKINTPGGICSPLHTIDRQELSLNTGFSSFMNSEGQRVLSLESSLVTAHELGHNWGSEHDPDTPSCAPPESGGGKYLMYQYAVSGFEYNNQFFSQCSRQYIYKVLQSKGYDCFKENKGFTLCGNGRIEAEEECDAGYKGDNCCSSDCKLNKTINAVCSPWNYECCAKSCQIAEKGTICHSLPDDVYTCKLSAKCDGVHRECQEPDPKDNGTDCVDMGKCYNGECVNYCGLRGLYPCICPRESGNACHRCCKKTTNGTDCESQGDLLPNGRPCYQGYCVNGVCEKQTSNVILRIHSLIEQITSDKFVDFMKANIVGTILIFSLVLWIPASCTFSHFDKKKERKYRRSQKLKSRSNHTLLMEEDLHRVRHCGTVKLKAAPVGAQWRNNNAIRHGIPGIPTIIPQSLERESKV